MVPGICINKINEFDLMSVGITGFQGVKS